jgi:hypothetical protein
MPGYGSSQNGRNLAEGGDGPWRGERCNAIGRGGNVRENETHRGDSIRVNQKPDTLEMRLLFKTLNATTPCRAVRAWPRHGARAGLPVLASPQTGIGRLLLILLASVSDGKRNKRQLKRHRASVLTMAMGLGQRRRSLSFGRRKAHV